MYAIGGRVDDFNHNVSRNDVYDPRRDAWSSGAPLPTARSGVAVALNDGRIDVIGGEHAAGTFTENESYDPRTNAWTEEAPLTEGRHGTGAAVVGDTLYLPAGGPTPGGSESNTLFIFTERR